MFSAVTRYSGSEKALLDLMQGTDAAGESNTPANTGAVLRH